LGTCGTESEAAGLLTWTRTIDRALVHRDAIAEVLLTDLIKVSPIEFLVAAQWPRSHRVYRPDRTGRHDPMLILETVRQVGLAVSHFGFGVTFERQSVMNNVGFRLNPDNEPRAVESATNLVIAVRCLDIVRRGTELRSMTVELRFAADGAKFAIGTGRISWLSRQTYTALRHRSGRQAAADKLLNKGNIGKPVVLATSVRGAEDSLIEAGGDAGGKSRRMVVPLDHPVYFDHALDHAPGMVLIDAAWQAVSELRGDDARLVSCLMQCPTFTELGLETNIELALTAPNTTQFSVEQAGRQTATGTLQVAG